MYKLLKRLVAMFSTDPSAGGQAQAAITVLPPVLNPSDGAQLMFATWRAGHIKRWLDDPANANSPQRNFLEAERDMHLSMLRLCGHDV